MPCRCKRFLRRSVPIATYNVTGIPEALAAMGEKRIGVPNVTLVFSNDINGMVSLKDAYMKMRYEYQEQVPVKQEKNTIKEDKKEKDKKEDKKDDKKTEDKKDDKKTEDKPGEDKPAEDKPTNEQPTPASENGTEAAPEAMEASAETKPVEDTAAEPKKEEVQTVTVTKRKIRKVSLRITPLTERLVILPMTKEQQEKSIAL